jgi:hypothetical protein
MKLTDNFYLSEFTHSDVANHLGLDNNPEDWQLINIRNICTHVLQPARDFLKDAIYINSGLRSEALNKAIAGAKNSQHMKGQAADIKCYDNASLFNFIKNKLTFDQLIWEFGNDSHPKWIHVSYKGIGNRKEVLRAIHEDGKIKYIRL